MLSGEEGEGNGEGEDAVDTWEVADAADEETVGAIEGIESVVEVERCSVTVLCAESIVVIGFPGETTHSSSRNYC